MPTHTTDTSYGYQCRPAPDHGAFRLIVSDAELRRLKFEERLRALSRCHE